MNRPSAPDASQSREGDSSKIVGGMFGLELGRHPERIASAWQPPFLRWPAMLLATARSALTLLRRMLAPSQVWLPSYLCAVVIPACSSTETKVRFYPVDDQLRVAGGAWLAEVRAGDIVVFIDYFGFRRWDDWGVEARTRGAWIVEDASQALLNDHFSPASHYVLCSPRKFVGVPDGGVLLAQGDARMPQVELSPPPDDWWRDALTASVRRAEFDRDPGARDRTWFELFQKVEPNGPIVPYAMSELTRLMLHHAVDWRSVAGRRRENYRFLADAVGAACLFPDLPEGIVPLGLPIRVARRDAARQALFEQRIYPPVHWSLEGVVPEEFAASHHLAREIMTIPCDQRVEGAGLARVADILRRWLRN